MHYPLDLSRGLCYYWGMKVIIKVIEKITPDEKVERDALENKRKQTALTPDEQSRQVFLEVKRFWNCEC